MNKAFVCAVGACVLTQSLAQGLPERRLEYDANGNLTKTIQVTGPTGEGNATRHVYDPMGRPVNSIDARGGVVHRMFTPQGQLALHIDPVLAQTSFARDGFGQVLASNSADSGAAAHTYDTAGRLRTRTDARGVVSTFSYDALGRLTRAEHVGGGALPQTFSWNYDESFDGTSSGVGRLTSISGPASYTRFSHDLQGNLTRQMQRVVDPNGGSPLIVDRTVDYTYDSEGSLVGITLPSGRIVAYTRSAGKVQAVSLSAGAGGSATPLISQVRYEPFGPVAAWQWHMGAGVRPHERLRDGAGRLVRYPLGNAIRDLIYDQADRIAAYTHAAGGVAAPSLNQYFVYDELDRLTEARAAGRIFRFGYDANGNRLSLSIDNVMGAYSIQSQSNRMLAAPHPNRTFAHDASGNMTTAGRSQPVVYDASGQVAAIGAQSLQTLFAYDAMGRRVHKYRAPAGAAASAEGELDPEPNPVPLPGAPPRLPRQSTVYVYDAAHHLLGEYNSRTGAVLREYVWLDDMPLAMLVPDQNNPNGEPIVYFVHSDHLDAPRVLIDRAGYERWRWLSEPFGIDLADGDPSGLGRVEISLRLPGQVFDAETGLHYNHHRYYDPTTGRYTQSDPIGLAGGINAYAYVGGNPVSRIDSRGLAYFAYRPLAFMGTNTLLCVVFGTCQVAHEQLFFEDGSPNIGYFDDGTLRSDDSNLYFRSPFSGHFDDCIMHEAVAQTPPLPKYNLICSNCQDWAAAVRAKYLILSKDSAVLAKCGGQCPR